MAAAGLAALVLAAAGWCLRGAIREEILLRRLDSKSSEEVRRAADDLVKSASARAIPAFLERMGTGGPRNEPWASRAEECAQKCGPRAVSALARFLDRGSASPLVTWRFARILSTIAPRCPSAIAALGSLLVQEQAAFRRPAFQLLEKIGADPMSFLLRGLSSANADVRMFCAVSLEEIGPGAAPAVEALERALKDPEPCIRVKAANALQEIGVLKEVFLPAIVKALRTGPLSLDAFRCIGRLGKEARSALPAIIQRLKDDPYEAAVSAAAAIGDEALVPVAALLGDEEPEVRSAALDVLRQLGPTARSAMREIRRALSDPNNGVSFAAARALVWISGPEDARLVLPVLVRALGSPREEEAIQDLSHLGAAAAPAVPEILKAIRRVGGRPSVSTLLSVFGCIGASAREAVPALVNFLGEPSSYPEIPITAAFSLLKMGASAEPAIPVLETVLSSSYPSIRVWAAAALIAMEPKRTGDLLPRITAVLRSDEADDRIQAAKSLRNLREAAWDAGPRLLEMALGDAEAGRAAAQALEKIGLPEGAVLRFAAALKEPDVEARRRAADAISWIGSPAKGTTPALVEALADADEGVRQLSARALGALGTGARSAIPSLERALRDRKRLVRDAAREALEKIRAPERADEERP